MILSDRSLREEIAAGRIVIDPFDDACIQPSSIDVKVGNLFRVFRNHTAGMIDVKHDLEDLTELDRRSPRTVCSCSTPASSCSARTLERVAVPDDLVARIEGKSSSAGSVCSSTRPPASSTPASTATSRSS